MPTSSLSEMRQQLKGIVEFLNENSNFSDADRAAVRQIQRKVADKAISRIDGDIQNLRKKSCAS